MACLQITYNMCRDGRRSMGMTKVRVLEKLGGKAGDWHAELSLCCPVRQLASDAAQVAQQPGRTYQAQPDDGHGQGQVELLQPRQRKAGVNHTGSHTQRGAYCRIARCLLRAQQYMPVAHEYHGDRRQVEHEESLYATRQVEHFPFAPVGSINLMQYE